jgi:hypothetical protein
MHQRDRRSIATPPPPVAGSMSFTMVLDPGRIGHVTESATDRPLDTGATLESFLSLLAAGIGDVRTSLATVLGHPELRIAYWVSGERWVSGDGERARTSMDPSRA